MTSFTMADIEDVLYENFLELLLWIIKQVLKLCGWIIKILWQGLVILLSLLWKGIKALLNLIFRNKETHIPNESDSMDSNLNYPGPTLLKERADNMSFANLKATISSIGTIGIDEREAKDLLFKTTVSIITHNELTIFQKGQLIELVDWKVFDLYPDPVEADRFFVSVIISAYDEINDLYYGIYTKNITDLKAAVEQNNCEDTLKPLGEYIIDIISAVESNNDVNRQFTFTPSMLDGIGLPIWRHYSA